MKHLTRLSALALACLLLLAGCGKEQPDTPAAPTEPPAQAATQPPTQLPEVRPTDAPDDPLAGLPEEDRQFIEDHAYWRETMGYVLEEDGYQTLDVMLLDSTEHLHDADVYRVWRAGSGIPGKREVQRLLVTLTPDGKDFNIKVEDDPAFDGRHKAVQNYLLLQADLLEGGAPQVLEGLGFDPAGDIPYTDFYAAMMRLVTPELYDQHYGQYFTDKEGKVAFDAGEAQTGTPLLLDALSQKADGSWLAEYHGFYAPGNLWPREANVTLSELPGGGYAVSGWEGLR